jgi:uncharacterized protein YqgC (DUF456 family)
MENILPWLEWASVGFIFFVMLVGWFGLIIPIFPGGVVIWLAGLVYGIAFGFNIVGIFLFALMTLLMLAIGLVDNVLMGAKALRQGASWLGIGLGLGAGILGTLFFPPIGGLIAAPLALFIVEFVRQKEFDEALEVTKGLLIGWGWSFVARFGLGFIMIVLWGIWLWSNNR